MTVEMFSKANAAPQGPKDHRYHLYFGQTAPLWCSFLSFNHVRLQRWFTKCLFLFCFVPYFLKSVTGIKLKNLLKTSYLPFSIFDAVFFYFLVNDGLNCLQVILFLFFVCLFVYYWGFLRFYMASHLFLNRFVFLLAWSYLSSHIWQLMAQMTKLHRKKRTSCCTPFLKPQTKQPTEQPSAGCKHTNWLLEGLSLHMLKPNLNHSVRS